MERVIMQDLLKWKESKGRKPLILEGARQVGKTYIMKEFGARYFENVAYFNFDTDRALGEIFSNTKDVGRILERLSLIANMSIEPNKTLIIFDEVQECGDALNSLKYFCEDAREYCVISAGSLLGTYLSQGYSYPVGKVDVLKMYPLTFEEFLLASDEGLCNIYKSISLSQKIEGVFAERFKEAYQKYLIVGGMHECVLAWVTEKDSNKVEQLQKNLLYIYERDITKHNGKVNASKILAVYKSIPTQLAKENKKFVYGKIKEGARAKEFEDAIVWLERAGLINIVSNVSKNEYPLKAYEEMGAFKIYFFDTGLLKCMSGVENESIILNKPFAFKGAITENFVLQQLVAIMHNNPFYYTFERYEVDFLIQHLGEIIPIEVKAGESVAGNSLNKYRDRYTPSLAIRYSMLNLDIQNGFINIPLYFAGRTLDILKTNKEGVDFH